MHRTRHVYLVLGPVWSAGEETFMGANDEHEIAYEQCECGMGPAERCEELSSVVSLGRPWHLNGWIDVDVDRL